MKEHLLKIGSYILVAALATALTLQFYPDGGKLTELEGLIEERFIGEAETKKLEDAAACGEGHVAMSRGQLPVNSKQDTEALNMTLMRNLKLPAST